MLYLNQVMEKLIKMNYCNLYKGKLTSCHTQAIFNGFFQNNSYDDYLLFEALTTNAFGVKYIPNDSNRVLDSFLDFDLGIDRALRILNIDFRIEYFNLNEFNIAFEMLKEWLKIDNVVIGPLNMEDLDYLYFSNLYKNLDHYLVVTDILDDELSIIDSEGFVNIKIDKKTLFKSWKKDKIIEGRGSFILRQITKKNSFKLTNKQLLKFLRFALENLSLAQKNSAYIILSKIDIEKYSYLKVALEYALPNRLQRIFIQKYFFKRFFEYGDINKLFNNQISILNQILQDIIEKKVYKLDSFYEIDLLENKIILEIERLIKCMD